MLKPKNKWDLKDIIDEAIKKNGSEVDLNYIDTSEITDMSWLFEGCDFNGRIDKWNTSNVKDMSYMFYNSKFNGDISKWDTSNVTNMRKMFFISQFDRNIEDWNTKSLKNCYQMFYNSGFTHNLYKWVMNKPELLLELKLSYIRDWNQLKCYGKWIEYD